MIRVEGQKIFVSTKTLDAVLDGGTLVSLKNKEGRSFITADREEEPTIEIVYRMGETVPVLHTREGSLTVYSLSDTAAEIRYDAWDGNGLLTISEDEETGALLIEPEVVSARYGVLAARYTFGGIAPELRIAAPFFQGIDLNIDDELITNRRWQWPKDWEAGLAVLHDGGSGGFWVHCEDTSYRAKSLVLKGRRLSFDSEAWGPIDRSLSAGGLVWKVNVFSGDWKVPAEEYRDWLWKAYRLEKEEARRPDWLSNISMAISWCPSDMALMDALAQKVDPKKVLLHLPNWRDKNYDQCYPDYTPSERFKKFFAYATKLGFHCAPHANSVDMDPSMPEYRYVQDFKYRELERGILPGWGWKDGKVLGTPASNKALDENRDANVMVKIHPGLALWRNILAGRIDEALSALNYGTDAVFIDVTLCSWNLDNCLVDNTTSMEGMNRLIEHVQCINGGLAVGGEGLNEITMQHLSFAQAHLFDSHHASRPGLERCGGCAMNDVLFGRLTKTIGYSNLSGRTEENILRERIHEEHGAVPTITIGSADEILNPNAEVARILELANS